MDEKDLKQIKEVVEDAVDTGIRTGLAEFWEHNLEPTFDALDERINIMEHKLDKALYKETERITKLENKMKVVEEKVGIKS